MATPTGRFVLRDLPFAARLVLATFLISVGIGYFSALVQLHFQHAPTGKPLPEPEDAVHAYHGRTGISQFERLLDTDDNKPFNGSGTMKPAFTTRSSGWKNKIKQAAKTRKVDLRQAETIVRAEREGERQALLEWARSGADRKAYDDDRYVLPASFGDRPLTEDFAGEDEQKRRTAKIASILDKRCLRCHSVNSSDSANQAPLDTYEEVRSYVDIETAGGGMSLKKLAQSTHVHLLGFSMLYGLTGLLFAFTSYPGVVRVIIGPLALVAQVVDISCWWLARLDPMYARVIVFTGAVVGGSLFLQIVLTLFNLFGKAGKVVLVLLLLAALGGGYLLNQKFVAPYLQREGVTATAPE